MKLISKESATVTFNAVADEIKPMKGYYLPHLFDRIAQRYALQEAPSVEQSRKTGAKFGTGQFISNGSEINISELAIYNDGISATTTDSEDSEVVVNDMFSWLKAELDFRDPPTPIFKTYQSLLVVEFERDPSEKLATLAPMMASIQREIGAVNAQASTAPAFQFQRLVFAFEGAPDITAFSIERRIGIPWASKRYFCRAPLTTAAHLRVLQQMEDL